MVRRSALRSDCTAVLAPRSCRVTRYALRAALEQTRQVRGRSARVRAPTPVLRSSSPHKSPLSGAARREAAAVLPDDNPTALPRSRRRAGRDAPERRREAQRRWPRAQRASTSDLAHLFERSAQARSELCARPGPRASQGSGADYRRTEASRPALRRLRPAQAAPTADREFRPWRRAPPQGAWRHRHRLQAVFRKSSSACASASGWSWCSMWPAGDSRSLRTDGTAARRCSNCSRV